MSAVRKTRSGREVPAAARSNAPQTGSGENRGLIKRFTWEIASINVYLEEIRLFWARAIGISGPQWMILMAISDLDEANGVPVNVVSRTLHVDPSFVTTQSKMLEKKGLLRRRPSPDDARVVQMSLTDKTCKLLASLAAQQETIDAFVFEEFGDKDLKDFTEKLSTVKSRLEKARLKVALDL